MVDGSAFWKSRVVVTNAALGQRLVNGTFHIDNLDNFPAQVQRLFGVSLDWIYAGDPSNLPKRIFDAAREKYPELFEEQPPPRRANGGA